MSAMAESHPPELREFIRLFNAGRYAESYEVLAPAWSENRANLFYKALMQMAGACEHWHDGSYYWAASLFRSAASLLEQYRPRHHGVDVDALISTLAACANVADARRRHREATHQLPPLQVSL